MTPEPCQGGCGCHLAVVHMYLREVTGDPEVGEVHTPRRCRIIRRFRETAAAELPDAEVVVAQPWSRVDALDVQARRGDAVAQGRVALTALLYARTDDLADATAVETARRLARALDRPEGHRPVSSSPVIARDPAQRR